MPQWSYPIIHESHESHEFVRFVGFVDSPVLVEAELLAKRVLDLRTALERLIGLLAKLPGMGPRSARRAALALLKRREQLLTPLAQALAGHLSQDEVQAAPNKPTETLAG